MIAAAAIVAGYLALIWFSGWAGLVVAAIHIGLMLAAMKR